MDNDVEEEEDEDIPICWPSTNSPIEFLDRGQSLTEVYTNADMQLKRAQPVGPVVIWITRIKIG